MLVCISGPWSDVVFTKPNFGPKILLPSKFELRKKNITKFGLSFEINLKNFVKNEKKSEISEKISAQRSDLFC